MTTKEKILKTISNLAEPVTFDDVLDEIILLEKIENGISQVHKGQVISDENLNNRLNKWLD